MLSHVRVQKLADMETGYLVNKGNALSLEHEQPWNINSDIEFKPPSSASNPDPVTLAPDPKPHIHLVGVVYTGLYIGYSRP